MTQPTASQHDKKLARQSARIIPVIPKQFSRKSLDKGSKKEPNGTELKTSTPVNGQTTPASVTTTSSPSIDGTTNDAEPASKPEVDDTESYSSQGNGSKNGVSNGHNGSLDGTNDSSTRSSEQDAADSNPQRMTAGASADSVASRTSSEKPTPAAKNTVDLPPPFYPSSRTANGSTAHAEPSRNRRSFVFGGAVESSATSPIPPTSAGSWNSGPGPSVANGSASPAPYTNGFRPGSQSNGVPASLPVNEQGPTPFYYHHAYTDSHTNQYFGGGHPPRQWRASQTMQSPRSPSIGSSPSEPNFAPSFQAFPQGPVSYYNGGIPTDGVIHGTPNMNRNMFPPFHSARTSIHFDPRNNGFPDPDLGNTLALREYLEATFDSGEFADCVFRLANDDIASLGHCAIVSRSSAIRRILSSSPPTSKGSDGRSLVTLDIPEDASLHDPSMFSLALRYLYGGPVVRREHLVNILDSPKQVMGSILSYIASGWYLEVPEIAAAGIALAGDFLVPENLEIALDFALRKTSNDESTDKNGHSMSTHVPKYGTYASELLKTIQRFMTFPLTEGVNFDPSAPELDTVPRIPIALRTSSGRSAHAARQSVSNPKLQGITLGSFQTHTSGNLVLSSLLLSIPSFALRSLFAQYAFRERMPPDAALALVRAVVDEREKRRGAALERFRGLADEKRQELRADVQALFMREQVETLPVEQGLFHVVLRSEEEDAA